MEPPSEYGVPNYEEAVQLAKAHFDVLEHVLMEDGTIECRIEPKSSTKEDFKAMLLELKKKNLLGFLRRRGSQVVLAIGKGIPPRRTNSRWVLILLVATVAVVGVDGWFKAVEFGDANLFQTAALYMLGVMGIIGIHELGHIVATKAHGLKASPPYFIPGIPGFFLVPTFGALIMVREPTSNRDALFDLGISGPLAGLAVAIAVAFGGAATSRLISVDEATKLAETSMIIPLNFGLLINGIFDLMGKVQMGKVILISPLGLAAWLGFLITFLNLIPAAQLDGGHIARATMGRSKHRIGTWIGIIVLVLLGYWIMALFVMMFATRAIEMRPLDDVSPLSTKRKTLFIVALVIAALCAPIPSAPGLPLG